MGKEATEEVEITDWPPLGPYGFDMIAGRQVWKYPLKLQPSNVIEVPEDSKVISVGIDPASGAVAIWVELIPESPKVSRRVYLCGTGHEILKDTRYIGTVCVDIFVWHVYV